MSDRKGPSIVDRRPGGRRITGSRCGTSRPLRTRRTVAAFFGDRRGVIVVMFALMLPILIGFLGLGVEIGYWYQNKRNLQSAADAGAIAGAYTAASSGATSASITAAATTDATRNGFSSGSGSITVNNPPTSGSYTANTKAVEVKLTRTVQLLFAGYFMSSAVTVNARAVATSANTGGDCMLSLHPSDDSSIKISGTANLQMNCSMSVPSTSSKGFDASGTAVIDATKICVAGGASVGGAVVFENATPTEGCSTPSDPLASLPEPAHTACDHTDFKISGSSGIHNLSPGVYCNGIEVSGNLNTVNFAAGTYILAGKGMKIAGSGNQINGTGVFFYNTDNFGDNAFGDVDFSGANTLTLSAPTSGTYAGVLFFDDRSTDSASAGKKFKMAGTVSHNLDGVVYYPVNDIEYAGTSVNVSGCGAKLIGQHLTFSGTVSLNWNQDSSCAGTNVVIGGTPNVSLVE